ncbi:MAG: hypothetical protein Q9M25_06175, partial [Mariprofundaceae bacterium]|nr:hypothetical protein [Mariprofundaceae bacterium]
MNEEVHVTTQLTPGFPDSGVEKCSFTVVNSAFSPCYQKNRKQSEQLQPFFGRMLITTQLTLGFPDSGVEKC